MTFDEAKLVLAAHGQEILGDLFQPCTCGMQQYLVRTVETGSTSVELPPPPDVPPSRICGSCKARHLVLAASAMATCPHDSEPVTVLLFTNLVEQYYSA